MRRDAMLFATKGTKERAKKNAVALLGLRALGAFRGERFVAAALAAISMSLVAGGAWGQEVGRIAERGGEAEVGRAGTWTAAAIGAALQLRDEVRTGLDGRVLIHFRDDSVLVIGPDSHLAIDEQVFDPERGVFESGMRLLRGKIRALVSEYYKEANSRFVVETVTAMSGVRGTDFVVVYDPVGEVTDVVGVSGRVSVHGALEPTKFGVFVTARELTRVPLGLFPTAPRLLDEREFRQYLSGLQFVGDGRLESMLENNSLLDGEEVPLPYRPESFAPPLLAGEGVAGSELYDFRSPDAITQPPAILDLIEQGLGDIGVRF